MAAAGLCQRSNLWEVFLKHPPAEQEDQQPPSAAEHDIPPPRYRQETSKFSHPNQEEEQLTTWCDKSNRTKTDTGYPRASHPFCMALPWKHRMLCWLICTNVLRRRLIKDILMGVKNTQNGPRLFWEVFSDKYCKAVWLCEFNETDLIKLAGITMIKWIDLISAHRDAADYAAKIKTVLLTKTMLFLL